MREREPIREALAALYYVDLRDMWPDDKQTIENAIVTLRRYEDRERRTMQERKRNA